MRIVVERPADGHLDERRLLAEPIGLPKFHHVAPPRPVRSAGGTWDQLWWATSWPALRTATHSPGLGLNGEAWREPGRADTPRLQKRQDAWRRLRSKLPARQGCGRGEAARDEARHGVNIEGEANDMAWHGGPFAFSAISAQAGRGKIENIDSFT